MPLHQLKLLIDELKTTNSSNSKIDILKKYPQCKEILAHTYDTLRYKYYVTSDVLIKLSNLTPSEVIPESIFSLLNDLCNRVYTGHDSVRKVNAFLTTIPKDYHELVYCIIDRNLKCRIDSKLINKVFPKLISQFNVALAEKYDEDKIKINFEETSYYASRKFDGVRNLTFLRSDVECISRQGEPFLTLDKLKTSLQDRLNIYPELNNLVLDGEICVVKEDGTDDFCGVMKQIRKKNHTIQNLKYFVFDCVTANEFYNEYSERPFETRLIELRKIVDKLNIPFVILATQISIKNKQQFLELKDSVVKYNWEGLILRKASSLYYGKRNKDMLKVKTFKDDEYVVESIESGPIRNIVDGVEVEEIMLSSVLIRHKKELVGVGSGFSINQRKDFYNNPSLIIGKTITVQYFEESKDVNGKLSLRFPTVKVIHGDERTT